jgi:hypothetical protein
MLKAVRAFAVSVCLLALAVPAAHAATYVVPSDAELIQRSDDVLVATGVSSNVERDTRGAIVTRYMLSVDRVLKGERVAGSRITLTEQGGILDGKARIIGGTPSYETGRQYLIFTATDPTMEPTTLGMGLGQFFMVQLDGQQLAMRAGVDGFDGNLGTHAEQPRDLSRFETYIRGIAAQRYAPVDYFVTDGARAPDAVKIVTNAGFSRGSYLMGGNFRWQTPSASFALSGARPGTQPPIAIPAGGAEGVSAAVASWSGAGAGITYSAGGIDNTAIKGLTDDDGRNTVLFGDPNGEVAAAGAGVVAIGGAWGDIQYPFDGENFIRIVEADVVVGSNVGFCFGSILTHEMGHTLGFRHSNQNASNAPCTPGGSIDCTSNAIMNSGLDSTLCARNGALLTWDSDAANTVYGAGPVCVPPSITTSPQSKSIGLGTSTTLSVVAAGSSPLTFAWFEGNPGDTTKPVGTNAATISITPTTTTTYWVRVTNTCSTQVANSTAATVTVTCIAPSITTQPNSANIVEGNSATLQVVAAGSGLSYQWFQGATGITTNPIGTNSPSLNVAPVATTQYWVRISGACGGPINSITATVNVTPCAELNVDAPTATPNPGIGNFRLNVNAFSSATPLQFQWFRGTTPGFGGTLIGSSQALNVTVTAVTSYWARVTNGCGKSAFSTLITVAPCTLPSISTQPEDKNIVTGNSAALSLGVGSPATTVTWYRGAVGDRTNSAGTGASVSVSPTETTQYWAELTNTCGAISSRQVTVTVEQATTNLFMLNRRFNVQVRYRNQFANPPSEGLLTGRSLLSSQLSDTAIFWFDSPLVVELMVRVSDARPFDNAFHVYLGGLSDVEFFITVKDTVTGKTVEYHKEANKLVGQIDRKSFPAPANATLLQDGVDALMHRATNAILGANADTSTLRMLDRYDVRIHYRNQFASPAVEGYLLGRAITKVSSTETAVFYFENPESVEWMVRFSDVRPFANRVDFFHGGLSDVEFTVEVTDTRTGAQKSYPVAPFSLAGGVDRQSFQP